MQLYSLFARARIIYMNQHSANREQHKPEVYSAKGRRSLFSRPSVHEAYIEARQMHEAHIEARHIHEATITRTAGVGNVGSQCIQNTASQTT